MEKVSLCYRPVSVVPTLSASFGCGSSHGWFSGRILIVGDSGTGKSVLVKQLIAGLCERQLRDSFFSYEEGHEDDLYSGLEEEEELDSFPVPEEGLVYEDDGQEGYGVFDELEKLEKFVDADAPPTRSDSLDEAGRNIEVKVHAPAGLRSSLKQSDMPQFGADHDEEGEDMEHVGPLPDLAQGTSRKRMFVSMRAKESYIEFPMQSPSFGPSGSPSLDNISAMTAIL